MLRPVSLGQSTSLFLRHLFQVQAPNKPHAVCLDMMRSQAQPQASSSGASEVGNRSRGCRHRSTSSVLLQRWMQHLVSSLVSQLLQQRQLPVLLRPGQRTCRQYRSISEHLSVCRSCNGASGPLRTWLAWSASLRLLRSTWSSWGQVCSPRPCKSALMAPGGARSSPSGPQVHKQPHSLKLYMHAAVAQARRAQTHGGPRCLQAHR